MVRKCGSRVRKPALGAEYVVEPSIRKPNARTLNKKRAVARTIAPALDLSAIAEGGNPFEDFDERAPRSGYRVPWTIDEDRVLVESVAARGLRKWTLLSKSLPGRTGKQCRERWTNHLDPDINHAPFNAAEDLAIQSGVLAHGHQWSLISKQLPGRSDNAIKNRYNACLNGFKRSSSWDDHGCTVHVTAGEVELKDAVARLDTATLLLELQRRNASVERAPIDCKHSVRWSCAEEIRLLEAVREEELRSHVGKHKKWTPMTAGSWNRIASAVGGRTSYACKRHWHLYSSGALSAPIKCRTPPWRPAQANLKGMTTEEFDLMLEGYENDVQDADLLCMETLGDLDGVDDRGARTDALAWAKSHIIVAGEPGLHFRFRKQHKRNLVPAATPDTPLPIPLPPKPPKVPRSKLIALSAKPTVIDYFAEKKRRDEAEALAKSVFA